MRDFLKDFNAEIDGKQVFAEIVKEENAIRLDVQHGDQVYTILRVQGSTEKRDLTEALFEFYILNHLK